MFLTRLSKNGIEGNPYWYKRPFNTEDPGIQLPNCTCYCMGRGNESAESEKGLAIANSVVGSFGNAKNWYKDSPLPKGTKIKEGSVVVFNGSYGHVLFVERIVERYSDTHCLCQISQSNYTSKNRTPSNSNYFQVKTYDIEIGVTTQGVGLVPVGCIYLPIRDKRVERNANAHQVRITYEMVKARKTPNGETYSGRYIPMGVYNILETAEAGGYRWVRLDDNTWCALVEGCYEEFEPTEDWENKYRAIRDEYEDYRHKVEEVFKEIKLSLDKLKE